MDSTQVLSRRDLAYTNQLTVKLRRSFLSLSSVKSPSSSTKPLSSSAMALWHLAFQPTNNQSSEINEVTPEDSVQTSESLTQKFEHFSPDNLPSAQSFLKMNETNKLDDKKHQSIDQKMRHPIPSPLNIEVPTSTDTDVNLTQSSTQETTTHDTIGTSTNHNLTTGHPSTFPPSLDDAMPTFKPAPNAIGQPKKVPSKCEQIKELLAQPGSPEFSFSTDDACGSRKDSLAPIKLPDMSSLT